MAGTGATFVAEGADHGVDPAFLVAVAGAESSFGLYLYSSGGDQADVQRLQLVLRLDLAGGRLRLLGRGDRRRGRRDRRRPVLRQRPLLGRRDRSALLPRRHRQLARQRRPLHAAARRRPARHALGRRRAARGRRGLLDSTAASSSRARRASSARPWRRASRSSTPALRRSRVDDVRLAVRDASGEAHDLAARRPCWPRARRAPRVRRLAWTLGRWGAGRAGSSSATAASACCSGTAPAFASAARLPRDPDLRRWVLAELRLCAAAPTPAHPQAASSASQHVREQPHDARRKRVPGVLARVVDRHVEAQQGVAAHERSQQPRQLVPVEAAGEQVVDGGHHRRREDVEVEVEPEAPRPLRERLARRSVPPRPARSAARRRRRRSARRGARRARPGRPARASPSGRGSPGPRRRRRGPAAARRRSR